MPWPVGIASERFIRDIDTEIRSRP
jgi:hypothetical protein